MKKNCDFSLRLPLPALTLGLAGSGGESREPWGYIAGGNAAWGLGGTSFGVFSRGQELLTPCFGSMEELGGNSQMQRNRRNKMNTKKRKNKTANTIRKIFIINYYSPTV
jgi:hypothetical protein